MDIIILIIGFIILIKGADIFVDGSCSIAGNFKISKMLVGLTIVAFGTSAPEFAVSIKAMLSGSGSVVLGNVIGSNIMNILLILGLSGLFSKIKVKNDTVKKELPLLLLGTTLLSVLFMDKFLDSVDTNILTRSDGAAIILFFCVFMYYLISVALKNRRDIKEKEEAKYTLMKSILYTLFGIVAIIIGSNAVVDSAINLAHLLGVSERLISLTIVALGTSLPELVTSIQAARKGELDIAVGNIIGSNIFNIGVVLGIPILLFGGVEAVGFSYLDVIMLLLSALILFIFSYTGREISKKESFIMLLMFILYYGYIIVF